MPRKKQIENDISVPEVKNDGKVIVNPDDIEAIDIKSPVDLDTQPVVPKIETEKITAEEKVVDDIIEATTEENINETEVKNEQVNNNAVTKDMFRNELLTIGYTLSKKILGENKDLNFNPLTEKHINSIECLINIYNTIK